MVRWLRTHGADCVSKANTSFARRGAPLAKIESIDWTRLQAIIWTPKAMKAHKAVAGLQRLRTEPIWGLLTADNGPYIIALLQTHLLEGGRSLPASILHERIARDLEDLRAEGADLPQTAQAYVAQWLSAGYIERRFPTGASEERYELSSAAAIAIRFIASLVEPRSAATESRLAAVIHQLTRLADETDVDPETRIAKLVAERDRIDREIEAVRQGRAKPLTDLQALERIREIIVLAVRTPVTPFL